MSFFRLLWPRRRAGDPDAPLLERLRQRLPPDGAPGLLPPGSEAEHHAEKEEAQRLVRELHGYARSPQGLGLGLARRAEAVAHAGRRRKPQELAEPLRGLTQTDVLALLERVLARRDLLRPATVQTAHRLLEETRELEVARGALLLLSLGARREDVELLLLAARLPALAPAAARAAASLPEDEALSTLLSMVQAADGVGRALIVEELLRSQDAQAVQPHGAALLLLVGVIADPLDRGWAAAPLLEIVDVPALLAEGGRPGELAMATARCLDATSRGGWRGGPGPGLGRLPGSILAAEALLALEGAEEARRLAAQAVLDSHPAPAGKAYDLARALVG